MCDYLNMCFHIIFFQKIVFRGYAPLSFFTFFIIWWVYVNGSWQSIYQIKAWDQLNTVFIIKLCWNLWRHQMMSYVSKRGLICYIILETACCVSDLLNMYPMNVEGDRLVCGPRFPLQLGVALVPLCFKL